MTNHLKLIRTIQVMKVIRC